MLIRSIEPLYLHVVQECEQVIGVSKRCCPVCHHLLPLLAHGRDDDPPNDFLVEKIHRTVTPTTLPIWLSKHVVEDMNKKFGAQLRAEMVKLMNASEGYRKRNSSTGSGGPSSYDSYKGRHLAINSPTYDDAANAHFPATPPL